MTFNLSKETTSFNLSKDKPLNIIKVLASWKQSKTEFDYDLDVFAVPMENNVPFYVDMCYPGLANGDNKNTNNSTCNNTIVHGSDNQVGGTEFLTIDLNNLPSNLTKIILGLNIYEPNKVKKEENKTITENQNFFMIDDESFEVIDMDNNKVLLKSNSDFIEKTIVENATVVDINTTLFEIGYLEKVDNQWLMTGTFKPWDKGLRDYLVNLGMK